MDNQILQLLNGRQTDKSLRENISVVMQKLISWCIDLIMDNENLIPPDLKTELSVIKKILQIEIPNQQLLLGIIDFYFANVREAFPQK